jgi:hypothetical protein
MRHDVVVLQELHGLAQSIAPQPFLELLMGLFRIRHPAVPDHCLSQLVRYTAMSPDPFKDIWR